MRALLDTHVLLRWLSDDRGFSVNHRRVVEAATPDEPLLLSVISLWEIANLHALGRIRLQLPLRDWLERMTATLGIQLIPISPAVAAEVEALPVTFHRDPADRIIVASARVAGATLLTQDARILQAGLVTTLS